MIVYFTGTGNSRFVAEKLAAANADTCVDAATYIRKGEGARFADPGDYVFVSPVYAAAPPLAFMDFIRRSHFPRSCRAYFVMTCAGSMGGSPAYCRKLACEKGLQYRGTAKVDMPQNYIAYFTMHTPRENRAAVRASLPEIKRLAGLIRSSEAFPEDKPRAWERILIPLVLKPYYKFFITAKPFHATEKCVGCGRCERVCPLGNITLSAGKPVWGKRCTHCMGCINLCPAEAIEYGEKTKGKPRYHGPNSV